MKWVFALLLWVSPALALPWQPSAIGPVVSPVFAFTCANASVSATTACTGTYTGTAPTSITSATWQSPLSGTATITSFTASGGTLSFTASTPSSAGTGQLSATSNIPHTALSNNVVISGAAIALVGHGLGSFSGTAGGAVTGVNMTGANLLTIVSSTFCGGGVTFTDSSSNTWTLVVDGTASCGAGGNTSIYEAVNPTVTSSMTFTLTSTTNAAFAVQGWSNASTTSPFGTGAVNGAGGATCAVSLTPGQANSLVLNSASGTHVQSGAIGAASGFTLIDSAAEVSGGSASIMAEYQIQTTATAVNPSPTFTSAPTTVCAIGSFHP